MIRIMKKTGLLLIALLAWGHWVQAAETGPVAEVFACNYIGNSGMSDIDSATDFYKQTIASMNNPAVSAIDAYLWTPFRAQTDADTLWFTIHENLNAFGAFSDAMAGSEGQAVQARYFEHVDCGSALYSMTQIYASETVEFSDPTTVEAYRCNLHEGKTMADVEATLEEWRAYVASEGTLDNNVTFMMTPIASAAPYDLYYFGVHDSVSSYAAWSTTNLATDAGQAMGAKFAALHRCEATVWNARAMIQSGM
jgi:hypothetical protein